MKPKTLNVIGTVCLTAAFFCYVCDSFVLEKYVATKFHGDTSVIAQTGWFGRSAVPYSGKLVKIPFYAPWALLSAGLLSIGLSIEPKKKKKGDNFA